MSKKNLALIAVIVGIFVVAFVSDKLVRKYVNLEGSGGSAVHDGEEGEHGTDSEEAHVDGDEHAMEEHMVLEEHVDGDEHMEDMHMLMEDEDEHDADADGDENEASVGGDEVHVSDHAPGDDVVRATRVVLAKDGYVVIHAVADGVPGAILGNSGMLSAGEHENVLVQLDSLLTAGTSLIAMLHSDNNGDAIFSPADDAPVLDEDGAVVLMKFSVDEEAPAAAAEPPAADEE